jgi:hypothetical protein
LKDLTVHRLTEANEFGTHHALCHVLVEWQTVEHQGNQLGKVQHGKLAKEVRVDGADVLQKDNLHKQLSKICFILIYY